MLFPPSLIVHRSPLPCFSSASDYNIGRGSSDFPNTFSFPILKSFICFCFCQSSTPMSAIICQGLQSLESQITETRPLRLKLSFPFPEKPNSEEINKNPSIPNFGNWSSFQSLSHSSQIPNQIPYSPPLAKKTHISTSLELCTENLGSETGTDTIESGDFSLSSPDLVGGIGKGENSTRRKPNSRRETDSRKMNFPPPLTTLSGSGSVQVRTHREAGRLIVEAVGGSLENSSTCFRAERSHGRLRLCFWKDSQQNDSLENDEDVDLEGNDEEKQDVEEEEEEEGESAEYVREDMDGNDLDVGGKMGMENLKRTRRCKVSGCGNGSFGSWEPFWVATS